MLGEILLVEFRLKEDEINKLITDCQGSLGVYKTMFTSLAP